VTVEKVSYNASNRIAVGSPFKDVISLRVSFYAISYFAKTAILPKTKTNNTRSVL
jgi:hypothetical protein